MVVKSEHNDFSYIIQPNNMHQPKRKNNIDVDLFDTLNKTNNEDVLTEVFDDTSLMTSLMIPNNKEDIAIDLKSNLWDIEVPPLRSDNALGIKQYDNTRIIVIDLENIQPSFPQHMARFEYNMHFFLSSYSTIDPEKYQAFGKVHIIDSSGSEAADHFMTYKIAQLAIKTPTNTEFIIVSRDKSSSLLVHMLKHDGFTTTHLKNAKAIESLLGVETDII